uniref:Biotin carboxyl carrier protein of acetyl-CoA carboxylase n=1 Tax=Plumaria plumosa TaxID=189642 RepID=A0A4D6WZI1_9FLOR|nr:acetyl-CoA carboxylase, biotin carboxyl carrier protein [Plumaria plumosa]
MIFKLNQLKEFLKSIDYNHINEIHVKSSQFEMVINKKSTTLKSIYTLNKQTTKGKIISKKSKKDYPNPTNVKIISNYSINKQNIQAKESETYSTIISPMVGTFYRSPAPNELSFIEKNDIVQKKQTVCIIEAMKLMNEIEAEVHGEIVEILVNDGDIVDCGQALMKVKTV